MSAIQACLRPWFALALVGSLLTLDASAEPPRVQFDAGFLVPCRDVTTPDFAVSNPHERLVEARFHVSSLIQQGDPDALLQFVYRMESPRKSLQIVDHSPKTTLATNVVGKVGIEKKREQVQSLGANVSTSYQQLGKGTANALAQNKSNDSVSYELLPPLELLAASGTVQRGSGVYFKLRPSTRTSLEGEREFVLVLRVPWSWQGDYMHLHCEADGQKGWVPSGSQRTRCGSATFVVALYQDGNTPAQRIAQQVAQSELDMRQSAAAYAKSIRKRTWRSPVHQFASYLQLAGPEIPGDWFEQVLYGSGDPASAAFVERLPGEVGASVQRYMSAKRALHGLSGT